MGWVAGAGVAGVLSVLGLADVMQRTSTLLAGVLVGISNFICTLSVGLINSAQIYDVLINAGIAALKETGLFDELYETYFMTETEETEAAE